jgi:hypothetical protein
MSVHFLCPKCETRLARESGEAARPCERCGASNDVAAPPADAVIGRCAACGHDELYFQKDFNRATGITLVVIGAVLAPFTYFISLAVVTILDWIIWRMVKNVIVCYRCQAVHRGYDVPPSIKPFDLATHDRHVYGAAPPGAEEGR